ncbi:hypothetical protein BGZ96_007784 [Linnemannia gamsii]|uniref:Uncharacterized protein n=1 Tax=Linnemannia gamsii TaxID=64522 RepID=A0ABQ7KDS8_9FUNG|nr:hypothetical protein BGZ96_007784 [Linnemannia gamsii]
MKSSTFRLLYLGQALALLTAAYAQLEFTIPKELFIGSDHTIEWTGRPSLSNSQQKVVLFKNNEPILILCEGYISGSGQCTFRLEEKDVNTIDRGNYGYYIGLQAPDGLSLDRTRDFTIQYEEDPAEERLRNGDGSGDNNEDEEDEEENDDMESREGDHHHKEKTKKKLTKNKKEDKLKAKAKEEDNDDNDDDEDDGDNGNDNGSDDDNDDSDGDEDNEDRNEDDEDDSEEFGIDMLMDLDDIDEKAWYQPVVAFGVPYPELPVTGSHSELSPNQQTTTEIHAIHAKAALTSSESQQPQPTFRHALVGTKAGANKVSTESAANNTVYQSSTVPQSPTLCKDTKRVSQGQN